MPPRKQAAIKEMGYGTNTKVITSYSDRLWRTKYRANGESFSDLDTSETWEATRYNDTKAGLITSFSGGKLGENIVLVTAAAIAILGAKISAIERNSLAIKSMVATLNMPSPMPAVVS